MKDAEVLRKLLDWGNDVNIILPNDRTSLVDLLQLQSRQYPVSYVTAISEIVTHRQMAELYLYIYENPTITRSNTAVSKGYGANEKLHKQKPDIFSPI